MKLNKNEDEALKHLNEAISLLVFNAKTITSVHKHMDMFKEDIFKVKDLLDEVYKIVK